MRTFHIVLSGNSMTWYSMLLEKSERNVLPEMLTEIDNQVVRAFVEGHRDSVPLRGRLDVVLTVRRARSH